VNRAHCSPRSGTRRQPADDTSGCSRRLLLALCACLPLLLIGCNEPRGVAADDIDLVTWFIEDVVHGNPRNPQELVLPDSSEEMERIATWFASSQTPDPKNRALYQPPRQLAERSDRWPVLKALFLQGQAVVLDDGLVAANPQLEKDDRAYALPIIDAENHDRRTIDALVISMARAERSQSKVWVARFAAARVALDVQGGAKRWVGKY
jgi:hypothetical protein